MTTQPKPRTHQPHWQDNTITARSQRRTSKDDAWANTISEGKYSTLRKLMTAIHKGEIELLVKPPVRTFPYIPPSDGKKRKK